MSNPGWIIRGKLWYLGCCPPAGFWFPTSIHRRGFEREDFMSSGIHDGVISIFRMSLVSPAGKSDFKSTLLSGIHRISWTGSERKKGTRKATE